MNKSLKVNTYILTSFLSKPLRPLRQGWEQVPRKAPGTFQEQSYTTTMGLRSTADSPPGRPNRLVIFDGVLVYRMPYFCACRSLK